MRPKAVPRLADRRASGAFMLRTSPSLSNDVAHRTSRRAADAMTCWHCVISRGPVKPSTISSSAASRNSPRMIVCLSFWTAPTHATSSPVHGHGLGDDAFDFVVVGDARLQRLAGQARLVEREQARRFRVRDGHLFRELVVDHWRRELRHHGLVRVEAAPCSLGSPRICATACIIVVNAFSCCSMAS